MTKISVKQLLTNGISILNKIDINRDIRGYMPELFSYLLPKLNGRIFRYNLTFGYQSQLIDQKRVNANVYAELPTTPNAAGSPHQYSE